VSLGQRKISGVVAVVCVVATLTSCAKDTKQPPLESLPELVARIVHHEPGGALAFTDAPTSYSVESKLYVRGHTNGDTGGEGAKLRTLLDATKVTRRVVRPFDETGALRRTIGFVREINSHSSRVDFVRPLPDDPRPQAYPPTAPARFRRTIAGRLCASYLIEGDEYCVDRQGIVLLTRTANSVELATKVTIGTDTQTADALAHKLSKGFTDTDRGSIRPIDPDTAPQGATDYSLDAAPDGFTLVGRYAVVPLTGEILKRNSRQVVAGIVDVYVRGGDAVVVERGGKLDTGEVGDQDLGVLIDAHDVDLGILGAGRAGIGGDGAFGYREVRATPSKGRYVVVAGTLPEADLVAIAHSLHAWPGDGMRYLDQPAPQG
jgi:hypothetical protein